MNEDLVGNIDRHSYIYNRPRIQWSKKSLKIMVVSKCRLVDRWKTFDFLAIMIWNLYSFLNGFQAEADLCQKANSQKKMKFEQFQTQSIFELIEHTKKCWLCSICISFLYSWLELPTFIEIDRTFKTLDYLFAQHIKLHF